MPRVKRGVTARARHKKVLALAKGFRGRRGNVFRIAKQAVMKAGQYAYRDRRAKKRVFRQLWIARINAAARECGLTYSQFANGLDLVHDASKSGLVVHGDVRQHFTVDFDGSLFQAIGEFAVGHAAFTSRCIDTSDPQLAEHTFLGTTVAVSVLTGLHHRLFSDAEDITAAAAETFGQGQYFFVTGSCRDTTFYARHIFSLFVSELQASRRQHLCHVTHVGLMHAY